MELACLLEIGQRAINAGRIKATYAELVEGAIRAIHEANMTRPDRWWAGKEYRERRKARFLAQGLCPYCGKRPPAPDKKMCIECGRIQRERNKRIA
jgi:hypothetical protein